MDRPAAFAGISYPAEPDRLRTWIGGHLTIGAGKAVPGPWRAIVAPHVDPALGGPVYGSAYAALRGHPARRFVILGISHAPARHPAIGTMEDYLTPLGPCPTDRPFIGKLAGTLPFDLCGEAILHRDEHSIEHQAIFLRGIHPDWGGRTIVPILCSAPPKKPAAEERLRFESEQSLFLRHLRSQLDGETLLIAATDFAHIGKPFGDPPGMAAAAREETRRLDGEMMEILAAGDLEALRRRNLSEGDRRRICGMPALEALLELLVETGGIVIDYGQSLDREAESLVTYGAISFA